MSFLKVKRKCEEDPKEVLVLASKKHKLQEVSDQVPIFELASSAVEEKDINNVILTTFKNCDVKSPKCNVEKIRARMREDNKERSRNNRYQLWTAPRKLDDAALEQSIPVIDVLDGGAAGKDENENEYVYDLYYCNTSLDVTDPDFSTNHVLHDISEEVEWEHQTDSDEEERPLDDDDSNDEDNWRNDYPDEEDSSEDDEDFLSNQLRRTRLSSDYSLSSSDEDYDKFYEACDYYDEVESDSNDEG